jgi:hypothetical protein
MQLSPFFSAQIMQNRKHTERRRRREREFLERE